MPSPWLMRELRRAGSLRAQHEEHDRAVEAAWPFPSGWRQRYRETVVRQQDACDVRDTYAAWHAACNEEAAC